VTVLKFALLLALCLALTPIALLGMALLPLLDLRPITEP
jgi:hypothetical protein